MIADIVFSGQDHKQFEDLGIPIEKIREQIAYLKNGLPWIELDRPATVEDGIRVIREEEMDYLRRLYAKHQESGRFSKFIPASGAASRMFELLFEFDRRKDEISIAILTKEAQQGQTKSQDFMGFLRRIKRLAFYEDLKRVIGRDLPDELASWKQQDIRDVLQGLLGKTGLDYGRCPKGLIKFHRYPDCSRTAFEEHLVEAFDYMKDRNNIVRTHFTISEEHESQVRQCVNAFQARYHSRRIVFDVTYSFQKISTATMALDDSGQPLRDEKGRLVFRPGGHGSLLENLKDLKADMVFIKNIDNIAPDTFKETVVLHQRILGGYLIRLQDKIFSFLHQLNGEISHVRFWEELEDFCMHELTLVLDASVLKAHEMEKRQYFHELLNRPIRVCGMVRNQGEPGGGPFWVREPNGKVSLQIVESSQIDPANPKQVAILKSSTHFNPVNLVCALRNYKGESFDLNAFVDTRAGLVTTKTKDGKPIKVLEWPGLWNGAMAKWTTVFIEVPAETFTPVKTVLDLLRPEHQN